MNITDAVALIKAYRSITPNTVIDSSVQKTIDDYNSMPVVLAMWKQDSSNNWYRNSEPKRCK